MTDSIPFTPLVSSLPAAVPFVGPETLERQRGAPFRARIGANESAFGMSPQALTAMRDTLPEASWYGDPENYLLRTALAAKHGVTIDQICVDAGIDSLLGLTVRMLAPPGAPVVTSLGAYPTFNYHVAGFGARLVTVAYRDDREDPQALLDAVQKEQAPLMYFANPDNPMGTWHNAKRVAELIDAVPPSCVLALDEAYIEFTDHPADIAPPLDTTNPRVLRFRTFSKAYGMAGLRIGYAVGHQDLITGLNKIRNHFAVNRVAQAGALASLHDEAFLANVLATVRQRRQQVYQLAESLGVPALPSQTNFVAVDLGTPQRATELQRRLTEADIFIRMPGAAPLNRCVRVGLGNEAEHAYFAEVFSRLLPTL